MNWDSPNSLHRLPLLRRLVGSCLVWLYLLTVTPAGPGLAALLAMADRSHHVTFEPTAARIRVVLSHQGCQAATDRHGMVARTLTLIAQQPVSGETDHIIQFSVTTSAEASSTLIMTLALASAVSACSSAGNLKFQAFRLTAAPTGKSRPPPYLHPSWLSIRSTVLLISVIPVERPRRFAVACADRGNCPVTRRTATVTRRFSASRLSPDS